MVTTVPLLEIFPRLRWFKQDFSAFRRCLLKLHHWFFERYLRHGSFTSHQLHPIFPPTAACSKEATEKRTSFPYLEILETPKCETQFIPHYIVIYTVYINVFYSIYKYIWPRIHNHRLCIYLANKSLFVFFVENWVFHWVINFVTHWTHWGRAWRFAPHWVILAVSRTTCEWREIRMDNVFMVNMSWYATNDDIDVV